MFEFILWVLAMLFMLFIFVMVSVQVCYTLSVERHEKAYNAVRERNTKFVDRNGRPWTGSIYFED